MEARDFSVLSTFFEEEINGEKNFCWYDFSVNSIQIPEVKGNTRGIQYVKVEINLV
jgi:hypothetical protein